MCTQNASNIGNFEVQQTTVYVLNIFGHISLKFLLLRQFHETAFHNYNAYKLFERYLERREPGLLIRYREGAEGWMTEVRFLSEVRFFFLYSTASWPPLRPTDSIPWVPGALSPGLRRPEREADRSIHLILRSTMVELNPHSPYVFMAWDNFTWNKESVHCVQYPLDAAAVLLVTFMTYFSVTYCEANSRTAG
jgi:hypothetical protein